MKLARYFGSGRVEIVDESKPSCPEGGLLVQAEASGLCSGELMDWYMDRKVPHVLGHEVAGRVVESQDARFPIGSRVAPHHHAPCLGCDACERGAYVHCPQWKRSRLVPGGMADFFQVGADNLTDTAIVNDLAPAEAALMEPLACVAKSVRRAHAGWEGGSPRVAVIGLGVMGLLHALVEANAIGYDLNPARREWASKFGIDARPNEDAEPVDLVYVCPGTIPAVEFAVSLVRPGGTILFFSPLGPPGQWAMDFDRIYFADLRLISSYSCGPNDTAQALRWLREGRVRADQVVSDFIRLEELPQAYLAMKSGTILKPMVLF